MEQLSPYPKYQNSLVGWLGSIPEHWRIIKVKYLFKEQDNRSENGIEDLLSVSQYTGVAKKSDRVTGNDNLTTAKTLEGYKVVEQGDLVINIMLAWNGSLGVSKFDGIVSPAYCVYKLLEGNEKYFGFLFKTKNAQQEFKKNSTGIIDSRLRLYTDNFFSIKTVVPPKEEQTAIARFLDYKLAKTNRFIFKKKRIIQLLNEQKAAIINQAVTKGLDPNAPMKDSGIEWLGELPKHWEVKKLKYVADFQSGEMITSETISETGDYPVYGGGGFRGYTNAYTNEGTHVLIGRQGALCGNIKYAEGKFWASEHSIVTYPKIEIENFYIGEIMGVANLGNLSQTAAQPGIAIGQIKNVKVPIPPITEQKSIVDFIRSETSIISTTISKIEKELALTEEYKTALIAEAVTGKIDVREYAIPELMEEEAEEMEEVLGIAAEDGENYQTEE